jgi:SOS-response transcriptional repressor LexA
MNKLKIQTILKNLLFKHELTPTELSRRINLPQQTIQRIITGKSISPKASTVEVLADYFGVKPEQLTGEESLLATEHAQLFQSPSLQSVLVYSWQELNTLLGKKEPASPCDIISVNNAYSEHCFALVMNDSSMEPYFSKHSILIIDPEVSCSDMSYVLVKIKETEKYLFRQLLSDGENYFLKALNSDLSSFPIRKLEKPDDIIGVVVETRQIHHKSAS